MSKIYTTITLRDTDQYSKLIYLELKQRDDEKIPMV